MNALDPDLRRKLEKAVLNARAVSETGARMALERLAVGAPEPFSEMSADERLLRNRLRAHGRQLGDTLDSRKAQTLDHLIQELAYEYWHRMLFARFLAENHLLIHPNEGIPVSLEECQELASEEGASDGWVLAARYASHSLPQIFRPDDPVLQVPFAPEHLRHLEKILGELSADVFRADDSLGWVYQFWQTNEKERVNKSGNKIGANELPAVTQLFTEHYMVLFLLHNTIGAWWVVNHPGEEWPDKLEYLRTLEDGTPAAGSFLGWPKTTKELKVLDPCCGSGHFLVAVFNLLVSLRMREENTNARSAADAVLRENLFGLEIDPRCTQIAAFALALAAWKLDGSGGYRQLPQLNIACSGIALRGKKEDWLKLANGDERLRDGMENLYDLFRQAPTLGSLISPHAGSKSDLYTANYAELQPLLERALKSEKAIQNLDLAAVGVSALGIARAAEILAGQYHLLITNVPYLGRGKQNITLMEFCENHYPLSKADLATVFVERCISLCKSNGKCALVTPQNWLFLGQYEKIRKKMLISASWNLLARLGEGAFETITGEVVKAILISFSKSSPIADHEMHGIDVSNIKTVKAKSQYLISNGLLSSNQMEQLSNPDARIVLGETIGTKSLLSNVAECYQGLVTGDRIRFVKFFWEVERFGKEWTLFKDSSTDDSVYGGQESILFWEGGNGQLKEYAEITRDRLHDMHESGNKSWGKLGVAIGRMTLKATLYLGEHYDNNTAVITPFSPEHLAAIWAFCSSPSFKDSIRKIDQKLNLTNATLIKVPFDLVYWQNIADKMGPLPVPHSDDPTQWLFKGNIINSTVPLQVAVARLLGYRWPDQTKDELDKFCDNDGIVCLPAVRGEQSASNRLQVLLATAYGIKWSSAKQTELLASVNADGKTLEQWLRDSFFEQHYKLFHQRPFIWHLWDGRRDGFSALVNYHKLDRKNLEKLTYTYLGDWIKRQEDSLAREEGGADARLLAARDLQDKLKLILAGEPPYDIFLRWKPIEQQPMGWDPDLNDGVRLNIRPFIEADVLRKRPNINWNKDRGKNPLGAPWGEERLNDVHLTVAEKQAARKGTAEATR